MAQGIIGTKTGKEAVRLAYAFLQCDFLHTPELTIMDFGANPPGQEGYAFSQEMVVGEYDAGNIPPFRELYKAARKYEFAMVCVASFDENDRDRVSVVFAFDENAGVIIKYNRPLSDDLNDIRRLIDYMENFRLEET